MKHYEDKSTSLFPHDFYVKIVAEGIQVNVYTLIDYRVATNNSARKSGLAKKTSRFSYLREMKDFGHSGGIWNGGIWLFLAFVITLFCF